MNGMEHTTIGSVQTKMMNNVGVFFSIKNNKE